MASGYRFLWVLHALVIILSCSLCVWALSRSRRILLPSFVLGFVVLDSIGLLFAPYVRNDFLPYISQGLATVDLLKLQHVYTRELTAHWIFLLVSSLFLLGETYSARKNGVVRMARISPRNKVFLILLKMFALFSYIRYFFLGPGLELLLSGICRIPGGGPWPYRPDLRPGKDCGRRRGAQEILLQKRIGQPVLEAMEERRAVLFSQPDRKASYRIFREEEGECRFSQVVIAPIIADSEPLGAVILVSGRPGVEFGELEVKSALTAASILAKQM